MVSPPSEVRALKMGLGLGSFNRLGIYAVFYDDFQPVFCEYVCGCLIREFCVNFCGVFIGNCRTIFGLILWLKQDENCAVPYTFRVRISDSLQF